MLNADFISGIHMLIHTGGGENERGVVLILDRDTKKYVLGYC